MIYHCGHEGCDICGGRICARIALNTVHIYRVCDPCLRKSVRLAVSVAEEFGGTIIDPARECGMPKGKVKP